MESHLTGVTPVGPSPVENTQLDLKSLTEIARRAETVDDFIQAIRARRGSSPCLLKRQP